MKLFRNDNIICLRSHHLNVFELGLLGYFHGNANNSNNKFVRLCTSSLRLFASFARGANRTVGSSQEVGLRDRLVIIRRGDFRLAVMNVRGASQLHTRQVKSSSGATRPRGGHPDPNLLLPSSSLRGLWRGLVEVGRRRSLSEAACYRNWPRSR